jgi:ribosomal protein L40E
MTANYTKGEWTVDKTELATFIQSPDTGYVVAICSRPEWVGEKKERDANAHLIAAAPLLYEALKEADATICELCVRLNPWHENCTSCEEREIRLKAIAKAEGVTQ